MNQKLRHRLYEACCFIDVDIIDCFLEQADDVAEIENQLVEMNRMARDNSERGFEIYEKSGHLDANKRVDFVFSDKPGKVEVETPEETLELEIYFKFDSFRVSFRPAYCGIHVLRTEKETRFLVDSPLGRFCASQDKFYDVYCWAWTDSNLWTSRFEESLVKLIASLDDYWTQSKESMAAIGGLTSLSLHETRKNLEEYAASAVENRDAYKIGLVSSAIRELTQSFSIMKFMQHFFHLSREAEKSFREAVIDFERERIRSCPEEQKERLREALLDLVDAGERYSTYLENVEIYHDLRHKTEVDRSFCSIWPGLKPRLLRVLEFENEFDPEALLDMQAEAKSGLPQLVQNLIPRQVNDFERSDTCESYVSWNIKTELTDSLVRRYCESSVQGAVICGSLIQTLTREEYFQSMDKILSAGMAYVIQAENNSLIALIDRSRAALPLTDRGVSLFLASRQRRNRVRDVGRVIRAERRKHHQFQLRANYTDFTEMCRKLNEHHGDNWAKETPCSLWEELRQISRFVVFELWFGNELIAADFGHLHGNGICYVTTRFFNKLFKKQQPGFILALAEAQWLRKQGFQIWDLGGTNSSPMMFYKTQVALPYSGYEYLYEIKKNRLRPSKTPEISGILVEDLQDEDLFGFLELKK